MEGGADEVRGGGRVVMAGARQLTLWSSGKTEAEKRRILHQTNDGKNARQRAQRKTATMNQKIIVKMRKELRPNAEIAKHLNLHVTTVVNFLREYFGDKDPLDLHVIESYRNGEGAKAIARRLNISTSIPCRILKANGIDPWKNYLERESESYRRIGVTKLALRPCKNPDRSRMIAEDLYCFWLEIKNIEQVALETGYVAASISSRFTKHIPGYKETSFLRRQQSIDNHKEIKTCHLSNEFSSEKLFQDTCSSALNEYTIEENVRGRSSIEIDLLVHDGNGKHMLIECKIRSRKPDLCKALGQSIINKSTYNGVGIPIICLPDDVRIYDSFAEEAFELGVHVCRLSGLNPLVCKLLK